ncbi:MAG TPA: SUKH-3 domain-containing protein [Streptomyces sp.]|uniref:SUKH-3 domain-containing protein n=1 Tax=Streptomyces sp. TaxID=1931 RepID=UPI002D6B6331|nr:SUKH-3 domain-containing protein [Streptomyces sp.]HZG01952.1 SUKH-3 domain-containing protein [Streptomyces sp.]
MRYPTTRQEAEAWFRRYGWSPERDIGAEADVLIRKAQEQAADDGVTLTPSEHARAFVRNYGGLKIFFRESPENYFVAKPELPFEGDAEEIKELSEALGEELFPLGYDTYDGAALLVDGRGRYFLLHHTGNYYLADDALQAVLNFLRGDTQDAEDFYA